MEECKLKQCKPKRCLALHAKLKYASNVERRGMATAPLVKLLSTPMLETSLATQLFGALFVALKLLRTRVVITLLALSVDMSFAMFARNNIHAFVVQLEFKIKFCEICAF
jgi:hypothetical protein